MRSKNFYLVCFFICALTAIIVKASRGSMFGENSVLDVFLGSSPSFLFLFGICSLIPIVQPQMTLQQFKSNMLFVAVGALIYEAGQYCSSMVFDVNDVIAICLAVLLMFVLHRKSHKGI